MLNIIILTSGHRCLDPIVNQYGQLLDKQYESHMVQFHVKTNKPLDEGVKGSVMLMIRQGLRNPA